MMAEALARPAARRRLWLAVAALACTVVLGAGRVGAQPVPVAVDAQVCTCVSVSSSLSVASLCSLSVSLYLWEVQSKTSG